ncbi:MAG: hypothetical protein LDL41_07405, partial [Coleofasciculus sp. S288]|nr:hypothetical protein [Coleofasciculus sp. S288]
MKFQKRLLTPMTQQSLDSGIMLTLIAAVALVVGSIPLTFSYEIINSPANNPALWGEAGLWSVLG